jgi:hypothetical protein
MRAKRNVIVVGDQPELRCALRIAANVNVLPAEDMTQLKKSLARFPLTDLVIIDRRSSPLLARRAADYCRSLPLINTVIIASFSEPLGEDPMCDVRDGCDFFERLRGVIALKLARKRGRMKGSHHLCLQ